MQPPALKTGHLSKFQLETLFYIFYALPKDVLQAYAAQELYTREWRYHAESKLWFKRATPSESGVVSGNGLSSGGQFIYFDIVLLFQFIHNAVEIWAGRRSPQQLQAMCHYKVYSELQKSAASLKEIGRVRKTRITQPLDGVCEATVTIRFGERLRVVAIRFEGLDGRWLCTCLTLI